MSTGQHDVPLLVRAERKRRSREGEGLVKWGWREEEE
jgi:hypothetical protein